MTTKKNVAKQNRTSSAQRRRMNVWSEMAMQSAEIRTRLQLAMNGEMLFINPDDRSDMRSKPMSAEERSNEMNDLRKASEIFKNIHSADYRAHKLDEFNPYEEEVEGGSDINRLSGAKLEKAIQLQEQMDKLLQEAESDNGK